MARTYHEEQNLEFSQRIREICSDMPDVYKRQV